MAVLMAAAAAAGAQGTPGSATVTGVVTDSASHSGLADVQVTVSSMDRAPGSGRAERVRPSEADIPSPAFLLGTSWSARG